jgi:hypothetical protein
MRGASSCLYAVSSGFFNRIKGAVGIAWRFVNRTFSFNLGYVNYSKLYIFHSYDHLIEPVDPV